MSPTLPFWFKQRQCKAEPAGDHALKVSGPNLGEAFLLVRQVEGGWQGVLRTAAEGQDVAASDSVPTPEDAWDAAFELYRQNVIV